MGRRNYCVNITGTSNEEVWAEIREVYGPKPVAGSAGTISLMNADIAEYEQFLIDSGRSVSFYKWLLWRLTTGTANYGNLSDNKKVKKVGHLYTLCPYDTQCDDLRAEHMLGGIPTQVTHEVSGVHYYMTNTARGNIWGYACTFPGCPFNITNGKPYFYV